MKIWSFFAKLILNNKWTWISIITAATIFMGYHATKIHISNEFNRSIPTDNPKFVEYQKFKQKFGEDGNALVIGLKEDTKKLFSTSYFNDYQQWMAGLKKIKGVESVLGVGNSITVIYDTASADYKVKPIFAAHYASQESLDSAKELFMSLPFYGDRLYNTQTHATLVAVKIRKELMNTDERKRIVAEIKTVSDAFSAKHNTELHYSGLPYIRTQIAKKLAAEGTLFTILSLILTAIILYLFFRSILATLFSLIVVLVGVVFTLGSIHLMGYQVTILTALVPTLIVVIGIPNCIYLINKYHLEYAHHGDRRLALEGVVEKMGIVTLFTNLTAAIGFFVFIFTKSALLTEFGWIASINILVIFVLSLILIPILFSFIAPPHKEDTNYLEMGFLQRIIKWLEHIVLHKRKAIYLTSLIVGLIGIAGMFRLHSLAYIVDDLPQKDPIYLDLKWFENQFHGIMPFEVIIDAHKKNRATNPKMFAKIEELETALHQYPEFSPTLSITEGLKFATQAYFGGDPENYRLPEGFEQAFVYDPLIKKKDKNTKGANMLTAFLDSNKQTARVSLTMKDVGSQKLPQLLDSIRPQVNAIFDTSKYTVTLTGASVIFLEGSKFIINGLRESLIYAFITIIFCMLWLFRSMRILLVSLLPNILPMVMTAGIMGWMGIPLKPSTVLIFSISLGIAIDVTIRFLVNYKQELPFHGGHIKPTVIRTIQETGVSIIYTSLVLFAGFFIFVVSDFGGTKALGLLTSLTLVFSMIANLTLLPALLLWVDKRVTKKAEKEEQKA